MRLRQCVFVCKDLESSREELCDILGIEVAYRDPGVAKWGLVNVVCPTGHVFLDMVILQVADAAAERKRVTDLGVRAVAQKDLPEYQYTHFHPSDTTGVLLSLDTTFAPPGVDADLWWPPAEKGWLKHARSDVTNGLAGVEIQHEDPDKAAATWSKILNRPVEDDIIRLDGSQIRFVPIVDGRGPGVSAYDVNVVDRERVLAAAHKRGKQRGPAQVEVCGCRINLV